MPSFIHNSLHGLLALCKLTVILCHNLHQFFVARLLWIPSQNRLRLSRIAPQIVHISRSEPLGIYAYQHLAGSCIVTLLINAGSFPTKVDANYFECALSEITYRMLLSGCDNKIFRSLMLQHQPHTLYIILGISPVS